jgi:hypothetical protein
VSLMGPPRPSPKLEKPVKTKRLKDFIHTLVCLLCKRPHPQQHHLLRCPSRHGQHAAGHQHSVPLCRDHHEELHLGPGTEIGFCERHDLDLLEIANFIFDNTGKTDTVINRIMEIANHDAVSN